MEDSVAPNPNSNPSPCWSNILKSKPAKLQSRNQITTPSQLFVESCKSTKRIAMAVVDANAIIEGGKKLNNIADKFVIVLEILAEIHDPVSRHHLAFIPFSIDSVEPSPDSLNKVIKFARATGDLQTLSDVDLKLIALTDLPGWGSNVPNLKMWEALECENGDGLNSNSRILLLKDLNMSVVSSDNRSEDGLVEEKGETYSENQEDADQGFRRPRRYLPHKKEVKIEGKKMVADGIDASQGQFDDNVDDWKPVVSRSTHTRFLRRKSRRECYEALVEKDCQEDMEKSIDKNNVEDASGPDQLLQQSAEEFHNGNRISMEAEQAEVDKGDGDLSSILKQMRLEEDSVKALHEETEAETAMEEDVLDGNANVVVEGVGEELEQLELSSQTNETELASYADDVSSEQSCMLRSLSESTVACVTGDFAMQNVLLQMGLRLLAPGGMQIRQLHRITLRGTKFSLPFPQGGRDVITKNLILREDQLPQKFLYPKTKKKVNKQGNDDLLMAGDTFTHHTDKRAPLRVRKALAVFSRKRNPNDNHYSRSKQK
ncbi:RNA-binding protein nob1, putative isoform 2 [Hibiscus syriacus]|uniref:RNA-binding protein nob1, putative isoform 2 n=1 Tax=Hibiscus syriacus TaxID=106335 RepID=A0A6A2X5F9_HIBSY|nr:RNA-binding protein nob1, putative isoform 2 [Hibiscus syriacus]